MNRSFSKKETFLSSKIMKRRLISLVIREMKTETQWDSYHFTHSIGRNYEFDNTVIGEDMETLSHCCYNINSFQLNPYKYLIFSYQYSIYFTGVGKHRLAVVNMWRGVNKAIVMIINCMSFYMWTTQPTFAHVHSSPLSVAARLRRCHTNHSSFINNAGVFLNRSI